MPFSLAFLDDTNDTIVDDLDPLITEQVIYDQYGNEIKRVKMNTTVTSINRNGAYFIDIIADFVFLADVFVICFSAYYDEN